MKKLLLMALVMLMVIGLMTSGAMAKEKTTVNYVALGDSVAAGVLFGLPTYPVSGTDLGYTDAIASKLKNEGVYGSFNKDFCTSGMTAGVLAQGSASLTVPGSYYNQMMKNTQIVTLDIGANDLLAPLYTCLNTQNQILTKITDYMNPGISTDLMGTINKLVSDGVLTHDEVQSLLDSIKNALNESLDELYAGKGLEVQRNIEIILQNILTANDDVRIYVMGYYNPLPELSAEFDINLDKPVKYFNTLIKNAIGNVKDSNEGVSITYVETMKAMRSSDTYLVPVDIHPTVDGYQAIAEEFWSKIKLNIR